MADDETVRCRKCRKVLITETGCLINAHSQRHQRGKAESSMETDECVIDSERSCFYLAEDSYPPFISEALDESLWTKGKLNCPGCQARLGSFNFISGSHCTCKSHIVPQVHLLVSKVDVRRIREVLPHPVSYPDRPIILSATNTLALPVLMSSGTPSESTGKSNLSATADLQACHDEDLTDLSSQGKTSQDSIAETDMMPLTSSNSQNKSPKRGNKLDMRYRRRTWEQGDIEDSISEPDEGLPYLKSTKTFNFHILSSEDISTESSSEDEELKMKPEEIPVHLTCSVCLDLLYSPLVAQPCTHVFCEPCLRRVARQNPTGTKCPLCRQLIGDCMSSKELALDIRKEFPDLLQQRHLFEQQHNIQHLPLPWNKNYRLKQHAVNGGNSLIQMAGGWRPILLLLAGNALGLGSLIFLKWYLESHREEGVEEECDADQYQSVEL